MPAAQSKKLLCAFTGEKRANQVLDTARHANKIVGGYLTGMIIESLIVAVVCFIGMSLMRMPYALLVSVIIGVTNVIPFFGPIIGAVISSALILLSDFRQGLIFIVFIIVLQQIEGNIIAPRVLGESTGVSPFWVTFSLLLFGSLFGFVGMLIGVPVFGVIYYIFDTFVDYRLKQRQLPTEMADYKNLDYFTEDGERVTTDGKKSQRELRKEEQKELRRQWMEENQENFEHWVQKHKKKEEEE